MIKIIVNRKIIKNFSVDGEIFRNSLIDSINVDRIMTNIPVAKATLIVFCSSMSNVLSVI